MGVKWSDDMESAPLVDTFLFLARGPRVTFGKWEDTPPRGWSSWDGGFPRKNPPTHWAPAPVQDWHGLRDWVNANGMPKGPE